MKYIDDKVKSGDQITILPDHIEQPMWEPFVQSRNNNLNLK